MEFLLKFGKLLLFKTERKKKSRWVSIPNVVFVNEPRTFTPTKVIARGKCLELNIKKNLQFYLP